jgi:hypothetical protein|tara:strand:- start:366 stop:557 length:192 start_codon:yes stop_codon:yes gene_type:complete
VAGSAVGFRQSYRTRLEFEISIKVFIVAGSPATTGGNAIHVHQRSTGFLWFAALNELPLIYVM